MRMYYAAVVCFEGCQRAWLDEVLGILSRVHCFEASGWKDLCFSTGVDLYPQLRLTPSIFRSVSNWSPTFLTFCTVWTANWTSSSSISLTYGFLRLCVFPWRLSFWAMNSCVAQHCFAQWFLLLHCWHVVPQAGHLLRAWSRQQ